MTDPQHPAPDGAPLTRRAARTGASATGAPSAAGRPAASPTTVHGVGEPRSTAERPGFEALFDGTAHTDDIGARPPRAGHGRRRRRRWVALIVVVVILGGLVAGGAWAMSAFGDRIRAAFGWSEPTDWEQGLAHDTATVTIASGDTGADVSRSLFDAGVTRTPTALYDLLVKTAPNQVFQPGTFRLQQQMSASAALAALQDPANRVENTVLIREGLTLDAILAATSDSLGIPRADLDAAVQSPGEYGVAADSLEGWLFPATYTFEPGTTAKQVVQRYVDRTVTALDDAGVPDADRERILTIASIIQREARKSSDFYRVSRVIQNRLDIGMKLQMDSTAQYGYGEIHDGTVSSSGAALSDANRWNTYVITGLPAGPIASPGDTAIDAALHPADGPWLYFVTVNLDTGETVFTTTGAEHEAAVQQWRAWCADHPDSGC